jgi:beta-galactosidase/beta-glucuronidase
VIDQNRTAGDGMRKGSSRGYPRPQVEREEWWNLNGRWEFAIDHDARCNVPGEVEFDKHIIVPFTPETPASEVEDTRLYKAVWYRRTFDAPPLHRQRLLLHFGAVDYECTVWVNGSPVVHHCGGYTPFSADISEYVQKGVNEIVVRAYDDPGDLEKPRGKQDWKLDPHSIWYPRTTGIWQTVWMERVPHTYIHKLTWRPNVERWEIDLLCQLAGPTHDGMTLRLKLFVGDHVLADDTYTVIRNEVHRRVALSDPGIDDYRNDLLWWPNTPTLIQAVVELRDARGQVVDHVRSYTALRSIGIQGDRFVLNGRPYYLRMVLDQGYWPQTGLTSPDDKALRADIELCKAMGFNGVRRHQKVSDPRFLYWADALGLLVW